MIFYHAGYRSIRKHGLNLARIPHTARRFALAATGGLRVAFVVLHDHHDVRMVRLVLFDIDGTLLRTGGAGMEAFARTAELVFHRPDGVRDMDFHGRTDTALVREFFERNEIAASNANFER